MSEVWSVIIIPSIMLVIGVFLEVWVDRWLLPRWERNKTGTVRVVNQPRRRETRRNGDTFSRKLFFWRRIRWRGFDLRVEKYRASLVAFFFIIVLLTGAASGVGAAAIVDEIDSGDVFSIVIIPSIVVGALTAIGAEYVFNVVEDYLLLRVFLAAFWGLVGGFIGAAIVYAFVCALGMLPLFLLLKAIFWSDSRPSNFYFRE